MEVTTFMALFYLFSLGAILVMRKVAPENMCWYPFYTVAIDIIITVVVYLHVTQGLYFQ